MTDAPRTLRIEPLTPARLPAYLAFFDHERGPAFRDNPSWARCYCHFFHVAPALDWQALDAPTNRVAIASRIETGEMEGFLAFEGDEVVGWMNAQPRHKLPHAFAHLDRAPTPLPVPAHEAALVLCFVVAPEHRGRGVARALLEGGLEALRARGIRIVDAFPSPSTATTPSTHYHGPRALYLSAGFVPLPGDEGALRRTLA